MIDPLTFDLAGIRVRASPWAKASGGHGLAVCPFRVVIDSREQLPYEFSGMTGATGELLVIPVVSRGLESGDYSIEGMEEKISVERKSLEDLYGSVTHDRDRFEREIFRLNVIVSQDRQRFAAVVIEASWPEIISPGEWRPGWVNRTEPRSVTETILAWAMRYPRVHWIPAGDRRRAEVLTFSLLRRFWKELSNG